MNTELFWYIGIPVIATAIATGLAAWFSTASEKLRNSIGAAIGVGLVTAAISGGVYWFDHSKVVAEQPSAIVAVLSPEDQAKIDAALKAAQDAATSAQTAAQAAKDATTIHQTLPQQGLTVTDVVMIINQQGVQGGGGQTIELNSEGYRGPTTGEVKLMLGLDVQRLTTEPASWVWRSVPNLVKLPHCPEGFKCTLDLGDSIKVFVGDGSSYRIQAGTFRFTEGFDPGDAVYEDPPCTLVQKEDLNGQREIPSFHVFPGNFTCAVSSYVPSTSATSCPVFAGVTTTSLSDGGCKFRSNSTVTSTVPSGWNANYWDGSQTQQAQSGATITTAEATFYKN